MWKRFGYGQETVVAQTKVCIVQGKMKLSTFGEMNGKALTEADIIVMAALESISATRASLDLHDSSC